MRPLRHVAFAQPHQVTLSSIDSRNLFSYPSDYLRFLRYLVEAAQRNACQLHGFALVGARAHLLMSPRTGSDLSNCIQVTCQRYAFARNRLMNRRGSLFSPRYLSRGVQLAELAQARELIEQQPVLAGKATAPQTYRWSSANPKLSAAFAVVSG